MLMTRVLAWFLLRNPMGIVSKSDAKIARRCEPGIDESLFHVLIPPLTPRRRVNPSMTHFSLSRAALGKSAPSSSWPFSELASSVFVSVA